MRFFARTSNFLPELVHSPLSQGVSVHNWIDSPSIVNMGRMKGIIEESASFEFILNFDKGTPSQNVYLVF